MKTIHEGRVWAWLHREIPEWEAEGIITAEGADRLRKRYPDPVHAVRPLGMVMIAVLGAGLIGAGIISLFAYNWDQLGRPERAVVALLPLLVSQILAWLALTRWKHSTAIREGVCVGMIAAIGTAISLIAQTYQIGGSFDRFMLTWFVLALPAVYLLRSGFGYTLCQIGLLVWAWPDWFYTSGSMHNSWYPLLMLVTLPYWFWVRRQPDTYTVQPILLKWVLAFVVPLGFTFWLIRVIEMNLWPVPYALYFALGVLLDRRQEATGLRYHPFALAGVIGTVVLMLLLATAGWHWRLDYWVTTADYWKIWLFCGVAGVVWLVVWVGMVFRREPWLAVFGSLPMALVLMLVLQGINEEMGMYFHSHTSVSELSFTIYTLIVGAWVAWAGYLRHQLLVLNLGLALVGLLAICRFFDSTYGFLLKGSVFIVIGVAFIVVNFFVSRRFPK